LTEAKCGARSHHIPYFLSAALRRSVFLTLCVRLCPRWIDSKYGDLTDYLIEESVFEKESRLGVFDEVLNERYQRDRRN
jgi:hypothetical protein